jgi:hypothetical protein
LKTSTVIVSIVAVTLGCLAVCGVGGYFWIKGKAGELAAEGPRIKEAGRAFAEGHSARDCVAEGLARAERGNGIIEQAKGRVFMRSCLDAVPDTEELCAGTPPLSEIMASVKWQLRTCTELGAQDQQMCGRVVQGVQDHCHAER